jgi:hypothetical protein
MQWPKHKERDGLFVPSIGVQAAACNENTTNSVTESRGNSVGTNTKKHASTHAEARSGLNDVTFAYKGGVSVSTHIPRRKMMIEGGEMMSI